MTLTITAKDQVYYWRETGVGRGAAKTKRRQVMRFGSSSWTPTSFSTSQQGRTNVCEMCVAVHWIFLTQIDKDSFSLVPIDSDWLKKAVEQKTVALATLSGDSDTLTASAKELKAFCREYADDKEVLKPIPEFTFKRNSRGHSL